jgi:excisionase family DNA binding protein
MSSQSPIPTNKRRPRPVADPGYFSISDFARCLGVSRVTVWRWLRDGRLKHLRFSSMIVRIPVSEIERLGREPVSKRPPLHLTRRTAHEKAPTNA